MMDIDNSLVVVIDVQGKLATLVHEYEQVIANIKRTISFAQVFNIPILWSEQAPDKIGVTIEEIAGLLAPAHKPITKRSFSCYGDVGFRKAIDASGRQQIVLVGIETHVCVYQSARDFFRQGYEVFVVEDAVSSKKQIQKDIAIQRMGNEGIHIVGTEMIATDWLQNADHPKFRDVMANIKR